MGSSQPAARDYSQREPADARPTTWAPQAPAVVPSTSWTRPTLLAFGTLLLMGGLFLFASIQTQAMFRASEFQSGLTNRNDGGILVAALIASIGLSLVLCALSHLPPLRRVLPAIGVALSSAVLLGFHFAFFVNGIIISDRSQLWVEASFLFQDTAGFPIGVFALATATFVITAVALVCAMALLTPHILTRRILRPRDLDEHRTRLVAVTAVLLAAGMTFAGQFFRWAFEADAAPTGGFIPTNVIALYYILGGLVAVGILLAAWRTWLLCWGDLRERTGPRFRRNHRNLIHLETWLWGTILLLTLIVMNTAPIFSVDAVALNQVFAANSHGLHMFFLLVPAAYILQRWISRDLFHHLQRNRRHLGVRPFDSLLGMVLALIAVWLAVPHMIRGDEVTPLNHLFIRTGLATLIVLGFALRVDATQSGIIAPRHAGTPVLVLLACTLAILTGIALWGSGNTVVTVYARESGGFLTPESRFLQPYTVLLRIAGAAFLALPAILALWLLSARVRNSTRPGHLAVTGIGILLAVNLLFTIQAADPLDPMVGRSDVLIGLYLLQMASPVDTAFMTLLWAAATLMTIYAATRIHLYVTGNRLIPRAQTRLKDNR